MLSLFPTYYVYLGGTFFPLLVVPSRTFFSGGGGGGGVDVHPVHPPAYAPG